MKNVQLEYIQVTPLTPTYILTRPSILILVVLNCAVLCECVYLFYLWFMFPLPK